MIAGAALFIGEQPCPKKAGRTAFCSEHGENQSFLLAFSGSLSLYLVQPLMQGDRT